MYLPFPCMAPVCPPAPMPPGRIRQMVWSPEATSMPSATIACHAGTEIFSQNCRPRCRPDVASPYAWLTRSKFYNLIVIFQYVIGLKIFLGKNEKIA